MCVCVCFETQHHRKGVIVQISRLEMQVHELQVALEHRSKEFAASSGALEREHTARADIIDALTHLQARSSQQETECASIKQEALLLTAELQSSESANKALLTQVRASVLLRWGADYFGS